MASKKATPKTNGNLFLWISPQDSRVFTFKSIADAFDADDDDENFTVVLEVKPIAAYTMETRDPEIVPADLDEAIKRLGA